MSKQRGIPSVSHTYRRLYMLNVQPIEIPFGDSYHQATICLKRHRVYTIIFRHQAGVVSQEAATSLRGSASLRSFGLRQEALELALTCDACDVSVQTAVGVTTQIINHNRNGSRPTCQWAQTDTLQRN